MKLQTLITCGSLCFVMLSRLAAQTAGLPQAPDSKHLVFEAVSIRSVEKSRSFPTSTGLRTLTTPTRDCEYRTDRVICQLTLRRLIQEAFQLKKPEMVSNTNLDGRLFLLQGLLPANTEKANARVMLQAALEERFHLTFHRERKMVTAYALFEGKHGLRLKPATHLERRQDSAATPAEGRGALVSMSPGQFSAKSITMDALADGLNAWAGIDLPVMNLTGLSGEYEIDLRWNPEEEEQGGSVRILDPGFPKALQDQLGLVLEKRKLSANVFVIDSVNPIPTEN